jgi:A/G-specific adenine glycosylase
MSDPYGVLVSEVMLQQTQVKTVVPYWERWMAALPTCESLARASLGRIHKLWEGLGYYSRVRNLQGAARSIMRDHGGKVPQKLEELLALPGIGRYTAGALCSIAFNQPTPVLDGNVMRVLARLFGISGNLKEKTTNAALWERAGELVRNAGQFHSKSGFRACSHFNQALMELGALVCTPKQPQCGICPLAAQCLALKQDRISELPNVPKRVLATHRRFIAVVAEKQGRYLIQQRPAGVINAHLWEFPNIEVPKRNAKAANRITSVFGLAPANLKPLCRLKHTITRYRITLDVFQTTGNAKLPIELVRRWVAPTEFTKLAFCSAHRRIVDALERSSSDARRTEGLPLRIIQNHAICAQV